MADHVSLTAPNGRRYDQPVGLFINNQFVPSKSGDSFATINPAYASTTPSTEYAFIANV